MQGVLAGRYRLERQLGKGGMGSVWLAEHLSLRSWVAVKLMDPAIAATPEGAERFRREAQAAASLRSAHVVQVLDYGVHELTPYLVMELLHGESLAGCIEREQRLSPERTVAIMTQVSRALGRAHNAGIVHRDLKPDNIFLVREDDQELVKILDFGIAKTPQAQFGGMETRTGVTMGTPYYMSPEQMEGKRALDFRTDLWAMGVITNECLTGVRPFDGSTFGELLLNICARPIPPPSAQGFRLRGFDEWFAKVTSRDPEQRFASAQELVSSLKDVVTAAGAAGFTQLPGPAPTTSMPAPTQSGQPYAPAATVGGSTVHGSAPSVASMSTSQALGERRPGASVLPWILLVLTLLGGAVAATVWVMRSKPSTPDAAASAPLSATPIEVAAPPSASTAEPAADPSGSAAKPANPPSPPSKPPATGASPAPPVNPPAPVPVALPTPAAAPVAKAARCFADPFSGSIRPLAGGQSATASFACKQDPFTGKYKRL